MRALQMTARATGYNMREVKKGNIGDSIVVNELIGHYVKYELGAQLDFERKFQSNATVFMKTVNLLPLLYDRLVVVDDLSGFPQRRFKELGEKEIVVTPIFAVDNDYNLPLSEFGKMMNKDLQRRPDFNFVRINFDKEADILDRLIQSDEHDLEYKKMIVRKSLTEWGPLTDRELLRPLQSFTLGVDFSLIVSKFLDLPIYIKSTHSEIWEYKFRTLVNEIRTLGKDHRKILKSTNLGIAASKKTSRAVRLLTSFLRDVNVTFPLDLDIDKIVAFRRDKARNNFKDWFFSKVDKAFKEEEPKDDIALAEDLVRDFNELSKSVYEYREKRSNLLNASLTGLSTGLASLLNPILAIPMATLAPFLLDKPTLDLCTRLMKKHSKKNWVVFFCEFKRVN